MDRWEMLDVVMRTKGLEDADTIYFATLVVNPDETDHAITIAYCNIMTDDTDFDEEDED